MISFRDIVFLGALVTIKRGGTIDRNIIVVSKLKEYCCNVGQLNILMNNDLNDNIHR